MVYTFEIIGILFALLMIYLAHLEYKRKKLSKKSFTFWLVVWIASVLLIVFHNPVNSLLPQLNIIRVLDLYMVIAFIFLFVLVFHLFVSVKNIERRMEEVIRHTALKSVKK